jgi:hypothetical protein
VLTSAVTTADGTANKGAASKNASEPARRLFNEQDIIIAIRSEAANGY